MTPYDLFRECSVSANSPGFAIRRKITDRVPFMSDRFVSTFYTCVIYISPKLSWHDGAHRSARHDYLMDCVRIRLNTQWLNSYELWANVCVSAHVVKASIKETKRFYKPCDVSRCCKSVLLLSFHARAFPSYLWFTTKCRGVIIYNDRILPNDINNLLILTSAALQRNCSTTLISVIDRYIQTKIALKRINILRNNYFAHLCFSIVL